MGLVNETGGRPNPIFLLGTQNISAVQQWEEKTKTADQEQRPARQSLPDLFVLHRRLELLSYTFIFCLTLCLFSFFFNYCPVVPTSGAGLPSSWLAFMDSSDGCWLWDQN